MQLAETNRRSSESDHGRAALESRMRLRDARRVRRGGVGKVLPASDRKSNSPAPYPTRAWQKEFGKSVGVRAPEMFIVWLKRTGAADGRHRRARVPTRSTKLS